VYKPFPACQIAAQYATSRRAGFANAANANVTSSTEGMFLELTMINCGADPLAAG
jgi:hypothetical protein